MNEPIDHSDQIIALRIAIGYLQEFDPDGNWQEFSLYKRWQKSHYSLNQDQMASLIAAMQNLANAARRNHFAESNRQINLFE